MKRRKITKAQRLSVYNRYGGKCAYCGKKIRYDEMQVDHIKPLYLGGADDESNWAPACRMCNYYKSTKTIAVFREELEKLRGRLEKDFIFRLALRYGLIRETSDKVQFLFEKEQDEESKMAVTAISDKIEGK